MNALATHGEPARLTALTRSGLLAGPSLPVLDRLVAQAARLCEAPMAAIALFTADEVLFVNRVGFDCAAIDRSEAPCDHPVHGPELCVIPDVAAPAGTTPKIRFYAAAPLIVGDGLIIGSLCVMAGAPRDLAPDRLDTLAVLAEAAAAQVEIRIRDAALADARSARDEAVRELGETSTRLANVQWLAQIGTWDFLPDEQLIGWSEEVYAILGVERGGPPTPEQWNALIHPEDRPRMREVEQRIWDDRDTRWDVELRIVRPDGAVRHVWSRAEVVHEGDRRRLVGTLQDITERKQMEAQLNAAVTELAMAGELARVGAWSVDLVAGKVSWSDEIYAIHEVPLGTRISIDGGIDYFAPETRDRARALFQACAQDGVPFDAEQELVTATGRRIWVRGIGLPVRNADGRIVGIRGAFQDIDALKRSEQEVRRLADRLEATLESITESFVVLDREWRFAYLNAEAARWMRRPRENLLGKVIWDELPELVGGTVQRNCFRAVRDGISFSFEVYFEPRASWLSVRVYPSSEGLAIYIQNVTEARRAMDALRESEERFKLVARAAADTIWDHDVRAETLWWSDDFAIRLGYAPEELPPCSANWRRVVHPDDLQRVLAMQEAAVAGGAESWDADYRLICRDGTVLHVLDRGFLMRDGEGRLVREIGGLTDISQRVEYEERLHQAQRLESIGHLTGGIAHDFNNLLTVILGNAELLMEGAAADARLHRLAKITMSAAQRGANLTSRLLAFARRQTLHPQAVGVNKLIAGMDELLRRTIGGAIEIEILAGERLDHALADPAQLESAILNLCINARDAMPDGGRLAIETAGVVLDDAYAAAHEGVKPGDYVMVSVADTGTGMPPAVIAQAFEPFFTTKGVGKGSGLGLSVIYGFVRQSGGHVTIESEVDVGTTVRLYLPAADRPLDADAEDGALADEQGGDERVLVVEDDELVRAHVTALLASLGYAVVSAGNGPEAVEILRGDAPFDLLFTDVVMPGGMNGRQVAEAARTLRPGLRVLYTSGYTDNVIGDHGGIELISKPYRRGDLARKMRQVLDAPG